jgi:hypothetical protein
MNTSVVYNVKVIGGPLSMEKRGRRDIAFRRGFLRGKGGGGPDVLDIEGEGLNLNGEEGVDGH